MKKLIAIIMAATVFLSQLSLVVFAADDNPLQSEDKITSEIIALKQREEEIQNKRAAQLAASKALVDYGKTTGRTDDLSFYINRKFLTKREYEAFKWSFIFTQFAHPLEDSLLDVFGQEYFQQMIDQDFNIESLRSVLINKGLAPSSDNASTSFDAELQAMMLQDTNFNELVEITKKNYAVYNIYNRNGSPITFSEMISGEQPLYGAYYVYDTLAVIRNGATVTENELNSLLYNQDKITDLDSKYEDQVEIQGIAASEEEDTAANATMVPVLFYDASTYLYMQTAITIYMKEHNIDTIEEVDAIFGSRPLVVDSYGNICVRITDNENLIFIPNFGNSIFTNSSDTTTGNPDEVKSDLMSKIYLYNLWFVSLYSKVTRGETTIYPENCKITLNSSGKSDHYSDYLKVGNSGVLSNTYLLTEPSEILPTSNCWEKPESAIQFEEYADQLGRFYTNTHYGEYYTNIWGSGHREEGRKTFISPYNSELNQFLPFTAPDGTAYFINKHPVVQVDMDYKVGNEDKPQGYTVFYRAGSCLLQGSWRYSYTNATHCGTTTITTSMNTTDNNTSQLAVVNWLACLATSLRPDQLIPDPRFSSCADNKSDLDDGSTRTFIYLPKEAIDLGQNMSAYKLSTEKGMFLAKYLLLFSGHVNSNENGGDLREYMKGVTEIMANPGSIVTNKSNFYTQFFGEDNVLFKDNVPNEDTAWLRNLTTCNSNDVISRSYFVLTYDMADSTVAAVLTKDFWDLVYDAYYGWISISDHANVVKPDLKAMYLIATEDDNGDTTYKLEPSCSLGDNQYLVDVYYYDTNYATPKLTNSEDGEVEYEKTGTGDAVLFVTSMYFAIMRRVCDNGFKTPDSFVSKATEYAKVCGMQDPDDAIYIMINGHRYKGTDGTPNTMLNIYFYDEYLYLLRSSIAAASTIGCKNSDTFVEATYYWDRYYLAKAQFNTDISTYLAEQKNSISGAITNYEDYLKKNFTTSLQYSFAKWLEDNPQEANISTKGLRYPFAYEYSLQSKSLAEWKSENSSITSVLTEDAQFYEYLNEDTIVVYPFGWSTNCKSIELHAGIGDGIYQKSAQSTYRTAIREQNYGQKINPIQTILALQKNTDYHHNCLTTTYQKKPQQTHVTREELMDKANTFFENPVSSLSYILTGFFYQVHETIATGDLGSVFSISYLTETDAYKWIMGRYIAIVTIAIAFVLFLKLIQFAMSKSKDFGHIGRSIVGILAMCMTPIIVFNSFIWAFDMTSSWALKSTTNKIMLAQLNRYAAECNNDGNVTAEKQAFKEQFSSIKGVYDCLSFHQMTNYSLDSGATYTTVPITDMVQNLLYSTAYTTWYSSEGFVPVHADRYKDSYYYFFYDYIKSVFLQYSVKNGDSNSVAKQAAIEFDANRGSLKQNEANQAAININAAENLLHTSKSTFRNMLLDTDFMYKYSVHETQTDRYGGPQVSDIVGLYLIFDNSFPSSDTGKLTAALQDTVAFRAYKDSDVMRISSDSMISDTWLNQSAIAEYVESQIALGKGYRSMVYEGQAYPICTSGLDLFATQNNDAAKQMDATRTETSPIYTPLEKVLISITEKTYDQTLEALNYLPDQINDETAIMLMAIIANDNLNEAMGFEPTQPIQQSILLDDVVATAFLTDLSNVGTGTNTLYSMIQQGDSVGKVALVLALEIVICVSSVLRVAIILYLTVASFVILMLRLLNKAPRTSALVYGIVGNVLALLFLHALTLFLVVIAVNWVANATSAIPGLVLDLLMIVFAILVAWFLVRLVKNIVKDAINLGGSKIRAGITKITDAIMNVAGKFQSPNAELNAEIAEINAQQSQTQKEIADALSDSQKTKNSRVDAVAERLKAAEEAEAIEDDKHTESTTDSSKAQELEEAEERHADK